MERNSEAVKSMIWVLASTTNFAPDVVHLAGALCVARKGLLVATVFGVCPRTKIVSSSNDSDDDDEDEREPDEYITEAEKFKVKAHHSLGGSFDTVLVYKCTEFGLLFYQVQNNDGIEFDFMNLGNLNQADFSLENVFGYLHHDWLTYSSLSVNNNYALPPNNVVLPDDASNLIVEFLSESEIERLSIERRDRNPIYRMVENTIDINGCKPDDARKKPILPEALQLYTKLPLLQFSGLGSETYHGSSGCSVFRLEDNMFVGLILFHLNSACFVLPSSVLRHCFAKYMGKSRKRRSQGGSGSGSGSGSRTRG